ncbi:MAG: nucleotide sugar dehydrogenase [Sediminibacterium sp.]|nr:nucleotide sugar dehydrogenase [Sediminibacterium sp.]
MKIANNNKKYIFGVIGLGYVGLPLCMAAAEEKYATIGFDLNKQLCKNLNKGISHIEDIDSSRLKKIISASLYKATSDFSLLANCDVISICVPTPLNKIKDPDLSYLVAAATTLSAFIKKGQTIILESTSYPGTTREIVLPILLKNKKLKVGKDIFICFSPERIDPGNKTWNIKNTPKIIGGITKNCCNNGIEFYSKIFDQLVPVENSEAAELIKVYENTFRMVNIALANELSQICDKLNLNVWKILEATATKPFGFMKFLPGPGIGGHCIPADPQYLAWKMKNLSFKTRLIDTAFEINTDIPNNIVEKIITILNEHGLALKNAKILIIGITYKKDVNDLRDSPAIEIINKLLHYQAHVKYYDPVCTKKASFIVKDFIKKNKCPELNATTIKNFNLCVILTNHSNIDYNLIKTNAKALLDTRGVL